jgi:3-deoxy-D-arabino-heptulosonate 7-phosphate (DAHP) synthase
MWAKTSAILAEEIPRTETASAKVCEARRAIEAILDGADRRLLVVVGRQNAPVTYGQSISDACLGFAETETLLYRLADAV